jgi:hypothetical protein
MGPPPIVYLVLVHSPGPATIEGRWAVDCLFLGQDLDRRPRPLVQRWLCGCRWFPRYEAPPQRGRHGVKVLSCRLQQEKPFRGSS